MTLWIILGSIACIAILTALYWYAKHAPAPDEDEWRPGRPNWWRKDISDDEWEG